MTKTFGGLQWWTDFRYSSGYFLQRNALTGSWRVLDQHNCQICSGERAECERELGKIVDSRLQADAPAQFVVLLHGLMRTARSMRTLADRIDQERLGPAICYRYASSRAEIGNHAAALVEFVESLPPAARLSFVGHSMGNIVLRAAIGRWQQLGDPIDVLPRMHRVVMLGPPNQGAMIARRLGWTGLFELVNGPGGMQLGTRWQELQSQLATPSCPFAILAGDCSGMLINNPLLPAANDLLVQVDEAKLDGAAEFRTMPIGHTFLMSDERAVDWVVGFLGHV